MFYQIVESANNSLSIAPASSLALGGAANCYDEADEPHMLLTTSTSMSMSAVHKQQQKKKHSSTLFDMIGAHPSVARVYTTAAGPGSSVVMEYIHGVSVGTFLRVLSVFGKAGITKINAGIDAISTPLSVGGEEEEENDGGVVVTQRLLESLETKGCDAEDLACFSEMYARFAKIGSIGLWSGDLISQLVSGVMFLYGYLFI
jgi:hypothetical protein